MKALRSDVRWPGADQQDDPISGRALAMLRAVSDGRGELILSCEPDLLIDGMGCCDQYTAHRLARAGLVRPAVLGEIGQRVRAELTVAGRAVLSPPENSPDSSHENAHDSSPENVLTIPSWWGGVTDRPLSYASYAG